MKPSLLLAVVLVSILSACTGKNSTSTAPSQESNPTRTTSALQDVPIVALTFLSPAFANQATTINASASSSAAIANCTLDLGDGNLVVFAPGDSATLKHIYAAAGTFTATLKCTDT